MSGGPDDTGQDDDLPATATQRVVTPMARFMMQVLWPAFLSAIAAEGVLFSLVDPRELVVVDLHLGNSREAAYTAGFFILWLLFCLSSGITWWLVTDKRD